MKRKENGKQLKITTIYLPKGGLTPVGEFAIHLRLKDTVWSPQTVDDKEVKPLTQVSKTGYNRIETRLLIYNKLS